MRRMSLNRLSNFNRRDFLLSIPGLLIALLGFRQVSVFAEEADLPAGKKAISESDPMATALGYKHDAKKADATKYPILKKPEGKDQRCLNCNFYSKENANWGKCQLLQSGMVNAKGWCASWIKKA